MGQQGEEERGATTMPTAILRDQSLPQIPDLLARLLESEVDDPGIIWEVRRSILFGIDSEDLYIRRLVRYARQLLPVGEAGYCSECFAPAALRCRGCGQLPLCSQLCSSRAWTQHQHFCHIEELTQAPPPLAPDVEPESVRCLYLGRDAEAPLVTRLPLLHFGGSWYPSHPDLPLEEAAWLLIETPVRTIPDQEVHFRVLKLSPRAAVDDRRNEALKVFTPNVDILAPGPLVVVALQTRRGKEVRYPSDFRDLTMADVHLFGKVLDDFVCWGSGEGLRHS